MPRTAEIPLPLRATIIAFKSPHYGKSTAEIHDLTGISISQINKIYAQAIRRGFEPNLLPSVILEEHLIDNPRSGRPSKQIEMNQRLILDKVTFDRYGHKKSYANIAGDLSNLRIETSAVTVRTILR